MAKEETTKKEVKAEKKVVAKKASAKKTVAKKTPAKKIVAKKTPVKKAVVKKVEKKEKKAFTGKYFSAIGRRKTSVARIRLYEKGNNQIIVNEKDYRDYFQTESMHAKVKEPLEKIKIADKMDISVVVKGGGLDSQAEAIRHGIARVLLELDPESRKRLRKEGLLTRDSRRKERKKFGLKRARKAPQWSKR